MEEPKDRYDMAARPGLEAYLTDDGQIVLHQDDISGGDEARVVLEPDQVPVVIEWLTALLEAATAESAED